MQCTLPLSSWIVCPWFAGPALAPAPLHESLRTTLDSFADQQLDRDLQGERKDARDVKRGLIPQMEAAS